MSDDYRPVDLGTTEIRSGGGEAFGVAMFIVGMLLALLVTR